MIHVTSLLPGSGADTGICFPLLLCSRNSSSPHGMPNAEGMIGSMCEQTSLGCPIKLNLFVLLGIMGDVNWEDLLLLSLHSAERKQCLSPCFHKPAH